METAETLILDALKEIVAIPAESRIDAYKTQVGIFYLNAMMFEFAATGINIGYTQIDSLGDVITVPDSALDAIMLNLALAISPAFKESITSIDLFEQAEESMDVLRELSYARPANASYSPNLPVGSGNESFDTSKFYDHSTTPILTENSGNIAYES